MQITILSLFPQNFTPFLNSSILLQAQKKGRIRFKLLDWRRFTDDKHQTVDDRPFGGGAGMLLKIEPIVKALEYSEAKFGVAHKILLSPQGRLWDQMQAVNLVKENPTHLLLLCGHYEGVDERVLSYIDEQVSIGPYVLSGGEAAAMVIVDSLVRLLPGVLKKEAATTEETFMQVGKQTLYEATQDSSVLALPGGTVSLLEYPQYTKPESFRGQSVPKVLLSGHHAQIQKWRLTKAWQKTKAAKPKN